MQQSTNNPQQIIHTSEYTLSCCITDHGARMKLILSLGYLRKIGVGALEANFDSVSGLGGLRYYCGSFYDVKWYLGTQGNFQIDKENMIMVVYGKRYNTDKNIMLTCIKFDTKQESISQIKQSRKQNQKVTSQEKNQSRNIQNFTDQRGKVQKQIDQLKIQPQNFKQTYSSLNKELNLLKQQYKNEKQQLKQQIQNIPNIIEQKLKKYKIQQFKLHINGVVERFQEKNLLFYQQNQKKLQKFQHRIKQIQKNVNKKITTIIAADWVDPQCYASLNKTIHLSQNRIQSILNQSTIVISRIKISQNKNFFIKVNKITSTYIGIGITDTKNKKQKNLPRNKFSYRSNKGLVDNMQILGSCGLGYCEGDIVEVDVDLMKRKICWKVDNVIRWQQQNDLIKQNIDWVPYITFLDANDQVQIVMANDC